MGLFDRFKAGLRRTRHQLSHELKRIVTGSPKLTEATLEELEAVLLAADLGLPLTEQIIAAVKQDRAQLISESADLLYHWLVVLSIAGVSHKEVMAELSRRTLSSGTAEKASRKGA